jgi:hypothetical protein
MKTAKTKLLVRQVIHVGDDLQREFKRQAGLYAWVSGMYAEAKKQSRVSKYELGVLSAQLRKKISLKFKGQRLTVADINGHIERNKKYVIKQKKLIDAEYNEDMLQGLVRALEHKREALMSLGANARHDMDGELRLLSKSIKHRVRNRMRDD